MRDISLLLGDILEAIEKIERQAARGRDVFDQDELLQVWIIHHLQVVGEAASRVPEAIRAAHPWVQWTEMIGMRNILVHEYFGIDLDTVWETVEKNLPSLRHQVQDILSAG